MKLFHLFLIILFLMSSACSGLPGLVETPVLTALPTLASTPPVSTSTPDAEPGPAGPVTLRIWVPPQFDPYADTEAGKLLLARLEEFVSRRPRVRLDIRVKPAQEQGGILDALSTTSAAAPLALPDLVLMPRSVMEAAALKGLLLPFDGLTSALESDDWYDYARQLGRLQNSNFGIPFGGDAQVLVYRPETIGEPPRDWTAALEMQTPLAFPAADPQALFTLGVYQAAGGVIQDAQGRPTIDASILAKILRLYQEGEAANLTPLWLTQLETDEQIWEAYQSGRADMIITWASQYLRALPQDSAAVLPPMIEIESYTLATGWVWTLANFNNEKRELAVRLVEYLTDPEFLSGWTLAAGYLPPRSAALALWPEGLPQAFSSQVVLAAQLSPSTDILSSLSPLFKTAVIQVIKKQGEPVGLAEEAVSHLQNP